MKYSQDEKVQHFLEDLEAAKLGEFEIVQKVREIVKSECPDVKERMMYGGIMFSAKEDFGGVFAYASHVSMEFSNGAAFDDPDGVLLGGGKNRRHLKFGSVDDVDEEIVRGFVRQAI